MPRTLPLWTSAIPALALVSFLGVYYTFTQFSHQGIEGLAASPGDTVEYAEMRLRLQMLTITVAYCFIVFVAVAALFLDLFSFELNDDTDGTDGTWRYSAHIRVTVAALFVAAIIVALAVVYSDDDDLYLYLGENLFQALFAICGEDSMCFGDDLAPDTYDMFLQIGVILGASGVAACALGSMLSLARVPAARYGQDEVNHAKFYLYLSSILLTLGLLGMTSSMRLPLAVLTDETARTVYSTHVQSVMLYWGVGFSVVILAYNLPTMVALHLSGANAAPPANDQSGNEPTRIPVRRPISSIKEIIAAALAFLTPALLSLSVELGGSLVALTGAG